MNEDLPKSCRHCQVNKKKQEMNFLIDMSHIDYNAEISVLKDEYNSYSSNIENIDQLEICGASSNEEF